MKKSNAVRNANSYSSAFIEIVGKNRDLIDKAIEFLEELDKLNSKNYNREQLLKALSENSFLKGDNIILQNFLIIIIKRNHLDILIDIAQSLKVKRDAIFNVITLEILLPDNISSDMKDTISNKIRLLFTQSQEIVLEYKIDPKIIRGFIVRFKYKEIDYSLDNKLQKIQECIYSRTICY
jgi:F0F1-type ATP synthase delta subunit